MSCGFVTRASNVARQRWKPSEGCVIFLFDDVTQFTGCSRLLPLYYLWLQTPPRSSCFCYYQHDWVTQQLLHFPIWKLGSTRRSIATHPPHPSRPSVRPKISVPTVTHRLSKQNNLSPTTISHYNHHHYTITTTTTTTTTTNTNTNHNPLATCPGSTTLAHLASSSRHFNITWCCLHQHNNSSFSSNSPAHHFLLSSCQRIRLPDYNIVWYSIQIKFIKTWHFMRSINHLVGFSERVRNEFEW